MSLCVPLPHRALGTGGLKSSVSSFSMDSLTNLPTCCYGHLLRLLLISYKHRHTPCCHLLRLCPRPCRLELGLYMAYAPAPCSSPSSLRRQAPGHCYKRSSVSPVVHTLHVFPPDTQRPQQNMKQSLTASTLRLRLLSSPSTSKQTEPPPNK